METSRLTTRILMEIEKLIARSCAGGEIPNEFQDLHKVLLRKHYNAASVDIDYDRQRVKMDVIVSDDDYDPSTVNVALQTMPVNIFFKNLFGFLKSCLEKDVKSLAFYSRLLLKYNNQNVMVSV
ncbi:hypothetical protein [Allomuricauda sp. d1]|uniref:hypothetical protein n=1 Tax=Allomuricauda sp. d1 TaxID=3136725 RepID=UPI0031DE02CC